MNFYETTGESYLFCIKIIDYEEIKFQMDTVPGIFNVWAIILYRSYFWW